MISYCRNIFLIICINECIHNRDLVNHLMTNPYNIPSNHYFRSLIQINNEKTHTNSKYIDNILQKREETDRVYKLSENSPFSDEIKLNFTKLPYFSIDEKYNIKAKMMKYSDPEVQIIGTSRGLEKEYYVYAKIEFMLDNKHYSLTMYKNVANGYFLVPFRDKTSGITSYGSGRYLYTEELDEVSVLLDFNQSYNPLCAYSDNYNCTLVPMSNHLDVEIDAGVKSFDREH